MKWPIWNQDHSKTGQRLTIQNPDMSGFKIPTVLDIDHLKSKPFKMAATFVPFSMVQIIQNLNLAVLDCFMYKEKSVKI